MLITIYKKMAFHVPKQQMYYACSQQLFNCMASHVPSNQSAMYVSNN